ncbi:serine hydrolase domain-containing protein [Mucilaginibacter antarcticus]|uniref:serine hydrolase domain-containing protein n=1 Tax=Mucilaginibacter antarcticus TaxID=1855725 RepID=UPI00362C862C
MKALRCLFLFVFVISFAANTTAQSRQLQKTDSVYRLIKRHIGTNDANAIYNLAHIRFKQSITLGNFRDFLFKELFSLGAIKQDSLETFVNNLTAGYKITFDNAPMLLTISLAEDDKLAYFKLEPYKAAPTTRPIPVPTSNPLKSQTDKLIDLVARRYIQKSNTFGLAIGTLIDGKTNTYFYGETKNGSGKLPNANTIFELASISKTFTATLLAWYINQGKIQLSDPITEYLPDTVSVNLALQKVTVLQLSNHTSGIPGLPNNFTKQINYTDANPYKNYTKQMMFAFLKSCTLRSEPGKSYAYSNLGVGLLGVILERVSKKTYEQMVTAIICKPLAMKSTMQHLPAPLAANFATLYDENGLPTPAWDFDALAACGSLKSTMTDLLLYAKANMVNTDSKLSQAFELTHQITFDCDAPVALGWHIITVDGVKYIFHNGGTGGSSSFWRLTAKRISGWSSCQTLPPV